MRRSRLLQAASTRCQLGCVGNRTLRPSADAKMEPSSVPVIEGAAADARTGECCSAAALVALSIARRQCACRVLNYEFAREKNALTRLLRTIELHPEIFKDRVSQVLLACYPGTHKGLGLGLKPLHLSAHVVTQKDAA